MNRGKVKENGKQLTSIIPASRPKGIKADRKGIKENA